MSSKEGVSVKILEREYKIACEPGERRQLLDAADLLNQQMRTIRDSGNIVGIEKIAVLTALNLASELLTLQQNQSSFTSDVAGRLKKLREQVEAATT